MSWDQPAYSFGTPSAQPPTPTQTPTSGQFPSPVFETPRNNSNFDNRSGWTPTFAEEYSVFNSTPGRLTGERHSFVDVATPILTSNPSNSRPLSGEIEAELSTHVHHLSPNPNLPLPPVDSSNQLPSSPGPYQTSHNRFDDSARKKVTPRKPRKRLEEAFSGQTATPPQTASKGSRKLAPKLQTDTMQNDSQANQYGLSHTPTHNTDFSAFPTTSADVFGFPLSAPATAPLFTNTKNFWDPDSNMGGMDLDFSADDANMFATGSHRVSNSFDWGRNNQLFQDNVNLPPPSQEMAQPAKRQRPLAPKLPRSNTDLPTSLAPFDFNSSNNNVTAHDDPFTAVSLDGSVNPGLLFSRNNSSNMSSGFEDVVLPPSRPATSHLVREPYQHQKRESRRDQEELRRTRSSRESSTSRRFDRGTASSPIRGSARPGLHRSQSDVRKNSQGRIMPRTGRTSPVKQIRPSSLTSIPESPIPRPRTEVIFTIDSKGKARTETVIIDPSPEPPRRRDPPRAPSISVHEEWDSASTRSSSDDEPIIIPSRNTSFNLPLPQKGPKLARFETTRRHSTALSHYSQSHSHTQSETSSQSIESEAETVMEDDDGSGDATRELRKVVETRKAQMGVKGRTPRHHRYASVGRRYYTGSSSNNSPTTVTDPDGATPSSTKSGTTRCVCGVEDGEGMMIQCESCEYWLHCTCVNIDEKSLPPVYICAFCAQTPNARNARGGTSRAAGRNVSGRGTSSRASREVVGSSPLAHKGFRSFR